jgi:uncharacterized membrane protein
MKKRIVAYLEYIDELLKKDGNDIDWDKEIEKHLTQIAFFSHERLVHLIVFALVAVCTVISILAMVVSEKIIIFPLIVLLFVLLIPYCMHYYLLENSVQRMYDQYDEMIAKKEKYFKSPVSPYR